MAKAKIHGEQYFLLHPSKRGTMELPVPMDDKAMARINEKLAAITAERLGVENKKRDMTAPLNKRLAELRQSEKNLVSEREAGQTTAPVQVEERASLEEGVAWVVRMDTGLEVPNTRRPLTPAERQSFAPARDGEEPRQTFPRAVSEPDEEDVDEESDADLGPAEGEDLLALMNPGGSGPAAEVPGAGEWRTELPDFPGWQVEESLGKGGVRLFLFTNGTRAFGPFTWNDGFHAPGKDEGLPEDVRAAIAKMFNEEPSTDDPRSRTEGFIIAAEKAVEERVALLVDLAAALSKGTASESAPSTAVGTLYELSGFPGWRLYVFGGLAYFRGPNVEATEPAGAPKDKGPFAWNPLEKMLDAVNTAPPELDAWMKEYSRMLEEADFLVSEKKVKEEVMELAPKATPSATPAESPGADDAAFADGEPEAAPGDTEPASVFTFDGWGLGFTGWRKEEEDDANATLLGLRLAKGELVGVATWDAGTQSLRISEPGVPVPDGILERVEKALQSGEVTLPVGGPESSSAAAVDVPTLAKKLSVPARKVVKLLAQPDAPGDSITIGNRTQSKAGAVLNTLLAKQLVTYDGKWHITPLGLAVADALQAK